MGQSVTSEATRRIAAPLAQVWQSVEAMDLPRIFPAFAPLPGVKAVEEQTGSWDVVGRTRILVLDDGARLREEITQVHLPDGTQAGFAYQVTGYSGLIGRMTQRAEGRWSFTAQQGATVAHWAYAYHPRGAVARGFLALINRLFWRRYMSACLARIDHMITGNAPAS